MDTVLLSVLRGHWRYAHINGVRGDGINPGLLARLLRRWLGGKWLPGLPDEAERLLSG